MVNYNPSVIGGFNTFTEDTNPPQKPMSAADEQDLANRASVKKPDAAIPQMPELNPYAKFVAADAENVERFVGRPVESEKEGVERARLMMDVRKMLDAPEEYLPQDHSAALEELNRRCTLTDQSLVNFTKQFGGEGVKPSDLLRMYVEKMDKVSSILSEPTGPRTDEAAQAFNDERWNEAMKFLGETFGDPDYLETRRAMAGMSREEQAAYARDWMIKNGKITQDDLIDEMNADKFTFPVTDAEKRAWVGSLKDDERADVMGMWNPEMTAYLDAIAEGKPYKETAERIELAKSPEARRYRDILKKREKWVREQRLLDKMEKSQTNERNFAAAMEIVPFMNEAQKQLVSAAAQGVDMNAYRGVFKLMDERTRNTMEAVCNAVRPETDAGLVSGLELGGKRFLNSMTEFTTAAFYQAFKDATAQDELAKEQKFNRDFNNTLGWNKLKDPSGWWEKAWVGLGESMPLQGSAIGGALAFRAATKLTPHPVARYGLTALGAGLEAMGLLSMAGDEYENLTLNGVRREDAIPLAFAAGIGNWMIENMNTEMILGTGLSAKELMRIGLVSSAKAGARCFSKKSVEQFGREFLFREFMETLRTDAAAAFKIAVSENFEEFVQGIVSKGTENFATGEKPLLTAFIDPETIEAGAKSFKEAMPTCTLFGISGALFPAGSAFGLNQNGARAGAMMRMDEQLDALLDEKVKNLGLDTKGEEFVKNWKAGERKRIENRAAQIVRGTDGMLPGESTRWLNEQADMTPAERAFYEDMVSFFNAARIQVGEVAAKAYADSNLQLFRYEAGGAKIAIDPETGKVTGVTFKDTDGDVTIGINDLTGETATRQNLDAKVVTDFISAWNEKNPDEAFAADPAEMDDAELARLDKALAENINGFYSESTGKITLTSQARAASLAHETGHATIWDALQNALDKQTGLSRSALRRIKVRAEKEMGISRRNDEATAERVEAKAAIEGATYKNALDYFEGADVGAAVKNIGKWIANIFRSKKAKSAYLPVIRKANVEAINPLQLVNEIVNEALPVALAEEKSRQKKNAEDKARGVARRGGNAADAVALRQQKREAKAAARKEQWQAIARKNWETAEAKAQAEKEFWDAIDAEIAAEEAAQARRAEEEQMAQLKAEEAAQAEEDRKNAKMLKNRKNAVKKIPALKAPNGADASAAGVAAYQAAWRAKTGKAVTQEEVDQLAERYGLPPEALNLKKTDKGYVLADEQILSDESLAKLADGLTAFYRDLTSVRIQVPDVVVANAEEAANAVPNEVYDPVSDTFIEGRIVIDADKAKTFREEAGMTEPSVSPEEIEEARQRRAEQRKIPSGKQKSADTDYPSAANEIREYKFSLGKKAREDAKALILKKRPDIAWVRKISDEEFISAMGDAFVSHPDGKAIQWKEGTKAKDIESASKDINASFVVDEIGKFATPKEQKAALHWFIKGAIRLPEDAPKVTEAIQYGERAKGKANTDPMSYDSPMAMIDALHEFKPRAKPINPDKVPQLSDKREMGNGVVTYLVQDDREGQQAMREIINTHWGEDANPWCLLHGDGHGHLSDGSDGGYDAWHYWNHYNALPKRVAFKDGKLLAFMATDEKPETYNGWEYQMRNEHPQYMSAYNKYVDEMDELGKDFLSEEEWMQENHSDEWDSWLSRYEGNGAKEQWWDRLDHSHEGIPLGNIPVPGDAFGRWADFEIREGESKQIGGFKKGIRGKDGFVEWYSNGVISEKISDGVKLVFNEDGTLSSYTTKDNHFTYHGSDVESVRTEYKDDNPTIKFYTGNANKGMMLKIESFGDYRILFGRLGKNPHISVTLGGNYLTFSMDGKLLERSPIDEDSDSTRFFGVPLADDSSELENAFAENIPSIEELAKSKVAEAERIYRENSQNRETKFSLANRLEEERKKIEAEGGRLILAAYHGTDTRGFTMFDKTDDIGFFFAKTKRTSQSYVRNSESGAYDNSGLVDYNDAMTYLRDEASGPKVESVWAIKEKTGDFLRPVRGQNVFDTKEDAEYILSMLGSVKEGASIVEADLFDGYKLYENGVPYDEAVKAYIEGTGEGSGVYEVAIRMKDPYIIDAEGANWDSIYDVFDIGDTTVYEMIKAEYDPFEDGFILRYKEKGGEIESESYATYDELIADVKAKFGREMEDHFKRWFKPNGDESDNFTACNIDDGPSGCVYSYDTFSEEGSFHYPQKTREIVEQAVEIGCDGVIIKNVLDNGGGVVEADVDDIYIALNPEQIKSVDGVTYDDNGHIIPDEKRLDWSNPDIRFSLGNGEWDKLEAHFGTTKDPREGGYILPNGHILDFSGAHWTNNRRAPNPGHRTVDHQDVKEVLEREFDDAWKYRAEMVNAGAIRLMPEHPSLTLSRDITKEQEDTIYDIVDAFRDEEFFVVNFHTQDWNDDGFISFPKKTSARAIINAIHSHYGAKIALNGLTGEGTDAQGRTRFSIATYNNGGRETLAKWIDGAVERKEISRKEADEILDETDSICSVATELAKTKDFAHFSKWSQAVVETDKDGNPLFGVIRPNGDYAYNLDFSTVCKKRRPLDHIFASLVEDGTITDANINILLSEKNIPRIQDIIKKHGLEVACALCFVDSKRYKIGEVAKNFSTLWNGIIDLHADGGKKWLDTLRKSESKNANARTFYDRAVILVGNDARTRVKVDSSWLISGDGMDEFSRKHPEIHNLYRSFGGVSKAKDAHDDVPWNNDILSVFNHILNPDNKFRAITREKAYAVGGVRLQSFSDFVPALFFDYAQRFAEMAARKLPMHTYTKEVDFVKIFGLTNDKINMSLVPAGTGIKWMSAAEGKKQNLIAVWGKNSKPVVKNGLTAFYDFSDECFPPEEAFKLRDAKGNVGTIMVGITDEHIALCLDDPRIDMVIPYHKSSLNPVVAKMRGIDKYDDYTKYQHTKGVKKEPFDFYADLAQTNDPRKTAANYLAFCKKMKYGAKFSDSKNHTDFTKHENYYKLLADFRLYDDGGKYSPQTDIVAKYPKNLTKILREALTHDQADQDALEKFTSPIKDEIRSEVFKMGNEFVRAKKVGKKSAPSAKSNRFSLGNDNAERVAALVGAVGILKGDALSDQALDAIRKSTRASISIPDLRREAERLAAENRRVLNYVAHDKAVDRLIARAGMADRMQKAIDRSRQADLAFATGVQKKMDRVNRANERVIRDTKGFTADTILNELGIDPAALLLSLRPAEVAKPVRTAPTEAEQTADTPHALDATMMGIAQQRAQELLGKARDAVALAKAEEAANPVEIDEDGNKKSNRKGTDENDPDVILGTMMQNAILSEIRNSGMSIDNPAEMVKLAEVITEDYIRNHAGLYQGIDLNDIWEDPRARALLGGNISRFAQMAAEAYCPTWTRERVAKKAQMLDDKAVRKLETIEEIGVHMFEDLNRDIVRESRKGLIKQIHKKIDTLARQHEENALNIDRKVSSALSGYLKKVKKAIDMSAEDVEKKIAELEDLCTSRYQGVDPDKANHYRDYSEAQDEIYILSYWGNLKSKMPSEIKADFEYLDQLVNEDLARMMADREEYIKHIDESVAAMVGGIAPDPKNKGKKPTDDPWAYSVVGMFEAKYRQYIRFCKDPAAAQAAREAFAAVEQMINDSTSAEVNFVTEFREKMKAIVDECYGSANNARKMLTEVYDAPWYWVKVEGDTNPQVEDDVGVTAKRALQMYVSIVQDDYTENVEKWGRNGEYRAKLERLLGLVDEDGNYIADAPHAKFVEGLRALYLEMGDRLDGVLVETTGTHLRTPNRNYMPVKMDRRIKRGKNGEGRAFSPFAPSLTPRIKNGRDFDQTADIIDIFLGRLSDTAHTIGWAKTGPLIMKIAQSDAIINTIENNFGDAEARRWNNYIFDIVAGPKFTNLRESKSMTAVMRYSSLLWLSLNLGSWAKQLTSIPCLALSNQVTFRDVAAGLSMWALKPIQMCRAAYDLASSDAFKARYGSAISNELRYAITDDGGFSTFKQKLVKGIMSGVVGFDKLGVLMASGVYFRRRQQLELQGKTSAEAADLAANWMMAIVDKSMQSGRTINLTETQRNGGLAAFIQFKSAPMQQAQFEMVAYEEWAADKTNAKKLKELVKTIVVNHFAVPFGMAVIDAAMAFLTSWGIPDEEKRERLYARILGEIFGGPFGSLFLIGAFVEYTADVLAQFATGSTSKYGTGIGQLVPAEGAIEFMGKNAEQIVKALEDIDNAEYIDTAAQIGLAVGNLIPGVSYVTRTGKKIYDSVTEDPREKEKKERNRARRKAKAERDKARKRK